ncbi:MAG TPA: hypothetical protein DEQ28_01045 [Clostridiales bacterium]|nr:hypothetical protein [Clostridiales bacterium]
MAGAVARGLGVRLGHTTVASARLHTISPARPGEVQVVTDGDAGQTFYRRERPGEILHVDIFHQVAEIDHRGMGYALLKAADRYCRDFAWSDGMGMPPGGRRLADHVDLQTATGGGRLSGSLAYGRRESLRHAHLNHVHLALKLQDAQLPLVFYMVAAAEAEVERQGHEIRKVEGVRCVRGGQRGEADFTPYTSHSDSLLLRRDSPSADPQVQRQIQHQTAMDLSDDIGSVTELEEFLEAFKAEPGKASALGKLKRLPNSGQWRERLEAMGLIVADRREYRLTDEGSRLYEYVRTHRREIELGLRKSLRRMTISSAELGGPSRPPVRVWDRRPGYSLAAPVPERAWIPGLAIPETMIAATVRRLTEGGARLCREDVWAYRRRKEEKLDLCLLVDASASMAGARLRAARHLAQHLLLSRRDRLAVIAFQERDATVHVPFTRSYGRVEVGLRSVRAQGLTPLATALVSAVDYLEHARTRKPLLLLITDGIPTVPKWTMNSLADAVEAARLVARRKIRFACIGLEPNRRFLEELAREGRASLHVVEEIQRERLAEIARQETAVLGR